MTRQDLRVAWYRLRVGFGRRRGSYLALVLLVGLVGGVAMGAVAAARRTQSSFSTYLASTNPSNLSVSVYGGFNGNSNAVSYSTSATRKIAHLPGVKHVEAAISLTAVPLRADGAPASALTPSSRLSRLPASTASTSARTAWRSRRAGWPTLIGRTRS